MLFKLFFASTKSIQWKLIFRTALSFWKYTNYDIKTFIYNATWIIKKSPFDQNKLICTIKMPEIVTNTLVDFKKTIKHAFWGLLAQFQSFDLMDLVTSTFVSLSLSLHKFHCFTKYWWCCANVVDNRKETHSSTYHHRSYLCSQFKLKNRSILLCVQLTLHERTAWWTASVIVVCNEVM